MDSLFNFSRPSKKKLIPMLLKLFHEVEMEAKFPNSFYEASISVVPILDKGRTKKKKPIHHFP
jgi:hypothetical protein